MRFSEPGDQDSQPALASSSRDRLRTILSTVVLTLVFFAVGFFLSVPVQDHTTDTIRSVRVLTLARLMMTHYPVDAPAFLPRDVFLVLILLAVPVCAYMLVAIWRLRES